jgi:hypothetical protein
MVNRFCFSKRGSAGAISGEISDGRSGWVKVVINCHFHSKDGEENEG